MLKFYFLRWILFFFLLSSTTFLCAAAEGPKQCDGGCPEDERHLKFKADPDNAHDMFCLALRHKHLGQHSEAIRWCKARIDKGGWQEEVWFCHYMIGQCYEELGFWDHALHWHLSAYQLNPARAEPLERIATHYRLLGQTELAYLFAKHGSQIPFPKDQSLFIEQSVYNYRFDEELAISSYYTRFKEEGYAAVNRLVLKRNVPPHTRELGYKNLLFYVENLKDADYQLIDIDLPLIREGSTERYHAMNPSLQKTSDGYAVICRTVNFAQSGGENYHSRDPLDPTIRTKNFLVHYDRHFKMCSQKEIIENIPRTRYPSRILGMEDCRLVKVNEDYWFTCTTYDNAPGAISQTLCKMAGTEVANTIDVDTFLPLSAGNPHCEKNWLPFTVGDDLFVIYACDPFLIYQVDKTTGECTVAKQYEPNHDFSRFRGSAGPIEFDGGYLMLIHEVVFHQGRHYLHRFLYLDENFNICKVSKPFTFMHKGIEYCCGMTIDHSGTKCILSLGVEDRDAFLCTTELDHVREMLEPLPFSRREGF